MSCHEVTHLHQYPKKLAHEKGLRRESQPLFFDACCDERRAILP
jgi:hypothetical protein